MERVYLVGKDDERASPGGFLNSDEALRLLRRAALDYDNLQHFREVWREQLKGGGSQPPTDRQVLQFLAGQLASGDLRLAGKKRPEPKPARAGGGGSGAAAPPKPPAPPKPVGPPPPPPLKLRPPDLPKEIPKVAAPVIDAAKQAECLESAARDGVAFVEQCAKL